MTIRVLDLPQWEEERMATVLCKACLERRVQAVEGAWYSRVERRGRPRKIPPEGDATMVWRRQTDRFTSQ
jgi:hypothetical protein